MSIHHVQAEVLAKEELIPGIFRVKLFSEMIAKEAQPGQFIHIRSGIGMNYILRRPLGIHRCLPGNAFEILFQVLGKGTKVLSEVRLHQTLDIIGPLGNPFNIPQGLSSALIVAGGLGVAPLMFLGEELKQRNIKFIVMQGAATERNLVCYMELRCLSRQVFTATEDGSIGHAGRITDILYDVIKKNKPERIYACGPEGMLKTVADVAETFEIGCDVSVERLMACGVGACLSCVCETTEGYKLACKDGPVFRGDELTWRA